MSKFLMNFILFLLLNVIISLPICEEGKNNCIKCNYINQKCLKCSKEILAPDENGGCKGAKICQPGINYCLECQEESNLCKLCVDGYFPDENGGCSYSNNCEISERGECLKCKNDYILIGENTYLFEGFILCKSIFSPDFKNCEEINIKKGICTKCKEGYYLNLIDKNCIDVDNCLESAFGKCLKCSYDYYLDLRENKCKKQEGLFSHCKQTLDGETCDICIEGYYFDEDGNCIDTNYCSKVGKLGECEKCISGYYLSNNKYKRACSKDKNCYEADKDSGLCLQCNENYYIDYQDGKCKLNTENNEFKYCKSARELCNNCINYYYLGEDFKCTNTRGCLESNNGTCVVCSEGYYLGLDNKCSLIKYCIYSLDEYNCKECLDEYYYNPKNKTCIKATGNYTNCKSINWNDEFCSSCKNNFYLNRSDNLCYSNDDFGQFYKCSYTDIFGQICLGCEKDFYYGYKYHICSKFEGCQLLEDENTCIECEEDYCHDLKNGNCIINYDIIDTDKLFYYGCIETNKEGTACSTCINNLTLDNGLCIDELHCEEEIDGKCQKCIIYDEDYYFYCLSPYLGCIEAFTDNCLECSNITNFNSCTKCEDGYQLDQYNDCVEKKEE